MNSRFVRFRAIFRHSPRPLPFRARVFPTAGRTSWNALVSGSPIAARVSRILCHALMLREVHRLHSGRDVGVGGDARRSGSSRALRRLSDWVGLAVGQARGEGDGKGSVTGCRGRVDDVVIGGAENWVSDHRNELEFVRVWSVSTRLWSSWQPFNPLFPVIICRRKFWRLRGRSKHRCKPVKTSI
jgi:hypothetical protein